MRLFGNKRDIIIVTGCNAVGKTTASNHLREWANKQNILYEKSIIADSQCLFEAMQKDDLEGGFHHTHDWCQPGIQGHSHYLDQPVFPFTVTDNELPNTMRQQFFSKLTELPNAGKLWFVEWAGGINTNPPEDPASCIDYSYSLVKRMFYDGTIPNGWLKRIKAVIHVEASPSVRFELNKKRVIPSLARVEAIEAGTAFWKKDEKVLQFYGLDDFNEIKEQLFPAKIRIYKLNNDGEGKESFFKNLDLIVNDLFSDDHLIVKMLKTMESLFRTNITSNYAEEDLSLTQGELAEENQEVRLLTS